MGGNGWLELGKWVGGRPGVQGGSLGMVDVVARDLHIPAAGRQLTLQKFARRKSTIAFVMVLPLILVVAGLVIYPALYAISLAMMNKSMQYFNIFTAKNNFAFLFGRNTFWMVVEQTVLFAVTAVIFKALIGFIAAHFVQIGRAHV